MKKAAHLATHHWQSPDPADSYSLPYHLALCIAGFCYALLGVLPRRMLLGHFNDGLTEVLVLVAFGGTACFLHGGMQGLHARNAFLAPHIGTLLVAQTMPRLVMAFARPDGTSLRWRGVRITNKVGYPTTIWGGTPGVWDEVKFASKVPPGAGPNDLVRVHAENTAAPEALFVDDLSVVLLRQPR